MLFALLLVALAAPPSAEGADSPPAAALAFPFFADDPTLTHIMFVNELNTGITVEIRVLEGDASGTWDTELTTCVLTGKEVALLGIRDDSGVTRIDSSGLSCNFAAATTASRGVVFVSVRAGGNAISGRAMVIENDRRVYTFDAIPFLLGSGPANTDNAFAFDGVELNTPPASSFAQILVPDGFSTTELILFTLDGRTGIPAEASATVSLVDDNGVRRLAAAPFTCFDVFDVRSLDASFTRDLTGAQFGWVEVTPIPRASDGRTIPVWGWVVYRVPEGFDLDDFMNGVGKSADRLIPNQSALVTPLHTPAFNDD